MCGLGDEAARARSKCRVDGCIVVRRGEHHDRHSGVVQHDIGEKVEPARTGKREVEQDHRDVGLGIEDRDRFRGIARRADAHFRLELRQQLSQCIHDQRMVVDHEHFHVFPLWRHVRTRPPGGTVERQ